MVNILFGIDERYCFSDKDWERIRPLLPKAKRKTVPGRPRVDDRKAITVILYVLQCADRRAWDTDCGNSRRSQLPRQETGGRHTALDSRPAA
jgi:Putative transposase of IS4/5 family (DUF4096)